MRMTPEELTAYLRSNIPLTGAMEVSAISVAPDAVVIEAPLAPNINHRKTAFGGSASALGIVAAWSLVHLRLTETSLEHRLVIQRNTMSYDAPIEGTFTAAAGFARGTDWPKFIETLERRGKARIGAVAELGYAGRRAGRLEADFVAILVR
jgi:thioesterase domain-containing protein